MSEQRESPTGHEELRDDLAAYALGALEDDEAARLGRHLAECDDCRQRLRRFEEAVEVLPRAVEQLEPPPGLRASLMETVRGESRQPEQRASDRPRQRWWQGLGAALRRPATALAVASALIVGVGIGYLISAPGEDGTTTLEARAMPSAHGATGVLERHGGSGILRVQGMPTLASDQVYEVWVERGGSFEPSSLFVPRGDRSADAAVPKGLDGADAVLVTKEPRGGSDQPTSAPILSVKLE